MRYQMAMRARRVTVTRRRWLSIEVTTPAMPALLLELAVGLFATYLALGALFAVPFIAVGVQRVDPAAAGASWGFRLLVLPGTVLLWPLLLSLWASGSAKAPEEQTAHRRLARRAS
jgi:hypothetical protein